MGISLNLLLFPLSTVAHSSTVLQLKLTQPQPRNSLSINIYSIENFVSNKQLSGTMLQMNTVRQPRKRLIVILNMLIYGGQHRQQRKFGTKLKYLRLRGESI